MKILLVLPLLLLAACASNEKKESAATPPTGPRTLQARLNEKNGYSQDADGNWGVTGESRRSSFESQRESAYFKGNVEKKEFKTTDYTKKSWWGKTEYDRKSYAGNTDGSRFKSTARDQSKSARETGKNVATSDYQTSNYATTSARESGAQRLSKTSDAETDIRRRVFTPPEILDWEQQRAFSVEQSKSILGR